MFINEFLWNTLGAEHQCHHAGLSRLGFFQIVHIMHTMKGAILLNELSVQALFF